MRPAPWFALINPSTLLFLSFLYTHSLAVVIVNSVVTPSGSSTIHQNDQIVVSWSAETSDPPAFDINLRTSDGRLILLMPNVSSQRPKRATMPVNNAPAPAVYTIAMSVNGKPLDTRGPSFTIEPGPGQAPTTNSPTPTNQPPPPTRSPTSPSTSTSSNIIVVTELTTTITEAVTAPLPTATSKSMEGVSPTPVESSAVSSDMPTIVYTSLFTNSDGYVVTTTIFPGSEPTSTPSQSGGSHKSSAGAIAGGVIGAFVLIGLIVAGVFWYRRRRRNRMAPSQMFRFLSRHQGSDTQNSPLHMHQTRYSGVNRTYEESDASGPPPPLYSNINAWLGKVRPA